MVLTPSPFKRLMSKELIRVYPKPDFAGEGGTEPARAPVKPEQAVLAPGQMLLLFAYTYRN